MADQNTFSDLRVPLSFLTSSERERVFAEYLAEQDCLELLTETIASIQLNGANPELARAVNDWVQAMASGLQVQMIAPPRAFADALSVQAAKWWYSDALEAYDAQYRAARSEDNA